MIRWQMKEKKKIKRNRKFIASVRWTVYDEQSERQIKEHTSENTIHTYIFNIRKITFYNNAQIPNRILLWPMSEKKNVFTIRWLQKSMTADQSTKK